MRSIVVQELEQQGFENYVEQEYFVCPECRCTAATEDHCPLCKARRNAWFYFSFSALKLLMAIMQTSEFFVAVSRGRQSEKVLSLALGIGFFCIAIGFFRLGKKAKKEAEEISR